VSGFFHAPQGALIRPLGRFALIVTVALVVAGSLGAQPPRENDYRAYPLRYKSAADVEQMLRDILPDLGRTTHLMADLKTNQILLRGSPQAHQVAQQFINSVDQPAAPQRQSERAVVRAYACEASRLKETAARLRTLFSGFGVRVAIDPRSPQLLVMAPPSLHEVILRQLAAIGPPAGRQPAAGSPSSRPATPAPRMTQAEGALAKMMAQRQPRREQFVALANVETSVVEARLKDIFGTRLERVSNGQSGWPDYLLADALGDHLEIRVDRQRNGLRVFGRASLTDQMVRLIRTLDSPRPVTGRKITVLPVGRADPAKIEEAVEAYRMGKGGTSRRTPGADQRSEFDYGNNGIQLVSYLLQEPAPAAQPAAQGPPQEQPPEEEPQPVPELGSDVEFEILPDLDVIILRGRESDVDEVTRLIEQIERISAETVPKIEIYYLKHVQGEAISTVVAQMMVDLLGGRQGRVAVTPLVKPNALLLIGWGEAVKTVKELIRKLDQPVSPNTQFRVFRLKHAPAATMGTTILQAFADRAGLGPQVQVTPEMRINALVVRASPRDMAEVELMIRQLDTDQPGAVTQTRMLKLKHSLAADLAITIQSAIRAAAGGVGTQKSSALELFDLEGQRLIRSGVLADVEVTPDVRTNTLIVSAPQESMELVMALIEQLDSPSAVAQIKVFRIHNGDASALAQMLQTLIPSAAGTGTAPQLPGAEGETTLVPAHFSIDTRTNSIIATGSEGDLNIIEALLLKLDEEDVEKRVNQVYRLKNAPALDVADSINEFLRSQRVIQQAAPGAMSPFQQIEREVIVVPEVVSNSLIISATPRVFEDMMELVEKLDEQPAQVMIQILIAEVRLDNADEFGVELGLQDSILFDRSLLGDLEKISSTVIQSGLTQVTTEEIVAASNKPGFLFNSQPNNESLGNTAAQKALAHSGVIGSQGVTNLGVNRINSELGFGGLVLSASSESVSLMIRALQESKRLDVLSRPQVMTLDNQPAFIQVGKRVPRITGSTAQTQGLVNTIDLENVGLIVGVTPRISPDGKVVMEIDAEKSELDPISTGIPVAVSGGTEIRSPSVSVTTAQTTVSAADGETIVLGGLISKKTSLIHRRVPMLADIPVLGNLFRFDSEICNRTELLIILTPHVVTEQEDSERVKRIEAARMHWCLADVNALHGDSGLVDLAAGPDTDGSGETIYPDTDPGGSGQIDPHDPDAKLDVLRPPVIKAPKAGPTPAPTPAPPPESSSRSGWGLFKWFRRAEPQGGERPSDDLRSAAPFVPPASTVDQTSDLSAGPRLAPGGPQASDTPKARPTSEVDPRVPQHDGSYELPVAQSGSADNFPYSPYIAGDPARAAGNPQGY